MAAGAFDPWAALLATIGGMFGEKIEVAKLNPFRKAEAERPKVASESDSKLAWKLLKQGLTQMAGGRGR